MKRKSAPITIDKPAFLYTSVCCGEFGEKQPCVKPKTKKEAEVNTLGSWRCGKCKKSCKVSRSKNTLDGIVN